MRTVTVRLLVALIVFLVPVPVMEAYAQIDTLWQMAPLVPLSDSSDVSPDSVIASIRYDNTASRDRVVGIAEPDANNDSLEWWLPILPTNFQKGVMPSGVIRYYFTTGSGKILREAWVPPSWAVRYVEDTVGANVALWRDAGAKTQTPLPLFSNAVASWLYGGQTGVITAQLIETNAIGAAEIATGAIDNDAVNITELLPADVHALDLDTAALENWLSMVDATGGGTLSLGRLLIDGPTDQVPVIIHANGIAKALFILADTTGAGLGNAIEVVGGGLGGDALYLRSKGGSGRGFYAVSQSGAGMQGGIDTVYNLALRYVWSQMDTTHVDTSAIGQWLVNNLAVAGSMTDADIDTLRYRIWRLLRSAESWPAGSFGYYLDAQISSVSGSAGSGSNVCSLRVVDTVLDVPIAYANVEVQFVSGTAETDWLPTDLNGWVVAYLDNGTWYAKVRQVGYFQEGGRESFVVSGAIFDTIPIYSYDPGIIAGVDSCVVNFYTDVPYAQAEISMHGLAREDNLKPVADTNGNWLDRNVVHINGRLPKANVNGVLSISLVRSNATKPHCAYDIILKNKYNKEFVRIENYAVPDSSSVTVVPQ